VKAALSRADRAVLRFQNPELRIEEEIERTMFEGWIAPELAQLSAAVDRVFLTGGTPFLPAVRRLFEARFGGERVSGGGEVVSVAEGLTLIGQKRLEV
jgi:hypothetical chaperone protein